MCGKRERQIGSRKYIKIFRLVATDLYFAFLGSTRFPKLTMSTDGEITLRAMTILMLLFIFAHGKVEYCSHIF